MELYSDDPNEYLKMLLQNPVDTTTHDAELLRFHFKVLHNIRCFNFFSKYFEEKHPYPYRYRINSKNIEAKVYTPGLTTVLCADEVFFKGVSGELEELGYLRQYEFNEAYAVAFKRGQEDFEKEFGIEKFHANNLAYAKTLHYKYFRFELPGMFGRGWIRIKEGGATTFTVDMSIAKTHGYYAGLVSSADDVLDYMKEEYPEIFQQCFKELCRVEDVSETEAATTPPPPPPAESDLLDYKCSKAQVEAYFMQLTRFYTKDLVEHFMKANFKGFAVDGEIIETAYFPKIKGLKQGHIRRFFYDFCNYRGGKVELRSEYIKLMFNSFEAFAETTVDTVDKSFSRVAPNNYPFST